MCVYYCAFLPWYMYLFSLSIKSMCGRMSQAVLTFVTPGY